MFVSRIECNEHTCNAMTAGKGRSFSYDFADKNISPKQISALSYIHRVLDYVTQHFDVPSNTYESRHKVVSLLLRSFGHILHHHFPDFIKDGYEHLLVNCLSDCVTSLIIFPSLRKMISSLFELGLNSSRKGTVS